VNRLNEKSFSSFWWCIPGLLFPPNNDVVSFALGVGVDEFGVKDELVENSLVVGVEITDAVKNCGNDEVDWLDSGVVSSLSSANSFC
jgi:hypothetical protein